MSDAAPGPGLLKNASKRGLLTVLLALAGCANFPASNSQEHKLFGEVYRDVIRYHLEEARADHLAIAGLGKLASLDPALAIEVEGGEVLLLHDGEVEHFTAPPVGDSSAWGDLTARVLDAARSASPTIAGSPADLLDETVLDGGLATLDPFSRYARPEVARERRAARDGFAGVGVTLDIQESSVRVASVLRDTPAAAAGLQVEDRIVAVDGVETASLTADAIRRRLRGPAGTLVTLEVARDGQQQSMTMVLRRARILQPSVSLDQLKDGIAVLRVRSFNQQTAQSAAELLRQAHIDMGDALHGIVLDLRDNPGGLLDQSVDLASLFIDTGMIASTIGRVPQSFQGFPAPSGLRVEKLPLAVLVNGSTASAAEVVAAALQDSGRGVVIGSSSYGKGTVQTVLRTANDGELTVTWAQLVAPRGYLLHHHGIVPTLCTDGVEDTPKLQRVPAELARPREEFDELGWIGLRARCPAERGTRDVDLQVARRLIDEPDLYGAAIATGPGGLARGAEARVDP